MDQKFLGKKMGTQSKKAGYSIKKIYFERKKCSFDFAFA
jgi:hypothetical protein